MLVHFNFFCALQVATSEMGSETAAIISVASATTDDGDVNKLCKRFSFFK